jgi:hypothetical protein
LIQMAFDKIVDHLTLARIDSSHSDGYRFSLDSELLMALKQ